jgi:hypothetical protein
MQVICYPKRRLTFTGLHGAISQKIELFITTAVRTTDPTQLFVCYINNIQQNIREQLNFSVEKRGDFYEVEHRNRKFVPLLSLPAIISGHLTELRRQRRTAQCKEPAGFYGNLSEPATVRVRKSLFSEHTHLERTGHQVYWPYSVARK